MYKRKIRSGHWSPTGESTIVENLGKRSTLRFYKDLPKQKTEWIAYEYEIAPNFILPNPGEFVIIKLMKSSREKRSKMKTNTSKQISQNTLISVNDGSRSPDEVMTMSNCYSHEVSTDFGSQNEANTIDMSIYSILQQFIQKDTVISYGSYVFSSGNGHENPEVFKFSSRFLDFCSRT